MKGSRTAKSNPEGPAAFWGMLISFLNNPLIMPAWSCICGGQKERLVSQDIWEDYRNQTSH